jgi:hypothetical protein
MTDSTLRLSAIAFASAIVSVSVYVAGGWNPVALDYGVFWRAIRQADPYRFGTWFVNPPSGLVFFEPLRLVGFWPGYVTWTALSLLLFFVAAHRLVGARPALLSLFSAASIHGVLLGQAPMILSAAILFAISVPSLWCGVTLGCVAAIKPQLLLAAPVVLLVRKDWTALFGMIGGVLAMVILGVVFFGVQTWFDWIAVLPKFNKAIVAFEVLRYVVTPAAWGAKLGQPMLPWLLVGIALAATLIHKFARDADGANLAALMVVSSILSSPYALPHDLVGAMPAAALFILSEPGIGYFGLAVAVFCGAFLPVTLPGAAAVAALHRRSSRISASGTIQTTRL